MSNSIIHLHEQRNRQQLLKQAADLICEAVGLDEHEAFYDEEKRLAEELKRVGLMVTQLRLSKHVEPEPRTVLINETPHTRVTSGAAVLLTPFGWVRIPRFLYRPTGVRAGGTIGLLEARVGIINGATPRMAELLGRYEATTTSREAVTLMELAGLSAPSRSRQEDKAGTIGSQLADRLDTVLDDVRSQQVLPEGAVSLTLGVDRISVPYHEETDEATVSERVRRLRAKVPHKRRPPIPFEVVWHMDFVACAVIRDAHGRVLAGYRYAQSHTQPIENLIDTLMKDVAWAKRANPELKVALCQDGARELWPPMWRALENLPEVKMEEVFAVVDFPHLWPRVKAVVEQVWGKEAEAGWKLRLLNTSGAMNELESELMLLLDTSWHSDTMHEALSELLSYIEERSDKNGFPDRRHKLFDYAAQRAAGLPVGSGDAEATAKSLVSVRLKRSGCRWKVPGARACMTLRALAMSDERWEVAFRFFALGHVHTVKPLAIDPKQHQAPSKEAA